MGAFERIGLHDPARDQSQDDYPRRLGNRLRQLRKQRGLTQRSLAQRLGVSTPALCRWEKGQTLPRKSNILAFAKEVKAWKPWLTPGNITNKTSAISFAKRLEPLGIAAQGIGAQMAAGEPGEPAAGAVAA